MSAEKEASTSIMARPFEISTMGLMFGLKEKKLHVLLLERSINIFEEENPIYDDKHVEGAIIKVNDYTKTYTNGSDIRSSGLVPYFFVESISLAHEQILTLGGKVALEKQDGRGDGWYAKYLDPDGNIFGLWEVRVQE
ncbi:hypothetical protein NHJ13051_008015 [Beauveria bassiana]